MFKVLIVGTETHDDISKFMRKESHVIEEKCNLSQCDTGSTTYVSRGAGWRQKPERTSHCVLFSHNSNTSTKKAPYAKPALMRHPLRLYSETVIGNLY
jgi:hypothetical protein